MKSIPVAKPDVTDAEISAVVAVMQRGELAQGREVALLEKLLAEKLGVSHAAAVSSGTAAIHSILAALQVGPGDEVIVPAFTFVGTVNPVLMVGATPVFVDTDEHDLMSPEAVAAAVSERTRAVIPVHLYGQMADMEGLRSAVGPDVAVIEDACQAVGACRFGVPAGAAGDAAAFSLYATKNVMSGEGGLVSTTRGDIDESIRRFRQHGMIGPYEYAELGFNYRMTDMQAAIARVQVGRLGEITAVRRRNAALLHAGLEGLPGIRLPEVAPGNQHAWHQYTVKIDRTAGGGRDAVAGLLRARGVGVGVYYPKPLVEYPHVRKASRVSGSLSNTYRACEEVLSLPVHSKVSGDDIAAVVEAVREVIRGE